jgi:polysaccharide biosynthesis transport protein
LSYYFEILRRADDEQRRLEAYGRPSTADSSRTSLADRNLDVRMARSSEPEWVRVALIFRKNWASALGFALAVVTVVIASTYLIRPVYAPIARLEVEPPGSEMPTSHDSNREATDPDYMETQVQILQSEALALATIRELHLDQDREFAGPKAGDTLENLGKPLKPPTQHTPSETELTHSETLALRSFQAGLTVNWIRNSRIIVISFASHDPRRAAQVTNTLAGLYMDWNYRTRIDAIQRLSHQLDDLRQRVEAANGKLAKVEESNGIVNVDDKQNTVMQKVGELNRQLALAQVDRIQLEAYVRTAEVGGVDALPQFRDDRLFQSLTQKLVDNRAQLAQALAVYGSNNPNVKKLQNTVDDLESQLSAQRTKAFQGLQTNYRSAKAREQLLAGALESMQGDIHSMIERDVQYNFLKKEAQVNEDLYNSLFARLKEAGIVAGLKSSNIRLLDQARILDKPTKPNRMVFAALGVVLGVLGGLMLPLLREKLNNTVRTPNDVRNWTGLSAVGVIPLSEERGKSRRGLPPATSEFLEGKPDSRQSEAVRTLCTSIKLARPGNGSRVILVVSPSPKDGKTTIAVKLAMTLASYGKTCLVDADLRRPMVACTFGLDSCKGLSNVLASSVPLDEVLFEVGEVKNLTILPSGSAAHDSGALVTSERMQDVVRTLAGRFQSVVIDSPPLIPFADARALSALADGVLLVGRSGWTTRDALVQSSEILEDVGVGGRLLGVVLNGADLRDSYYRYYRYE